jgi:hypothetical protein
MSRPAVKVADILRAQGSRFPDKLSRIVSDLLGASGKRFLRALADGETDPARLAKLGDKRLPASEAELRDALSGQTQAIHRQLLTLYLARLDLIETQMESLNQNDCRSNESSPGGGRTLGRVAGAGS